MRNEEKIYYRHRRRFNKLISSWRMAKRGSRAAFLLLESNLLQRTLPLQSKRRIQCAVWNAQVNHLCSTIFPTCKPCWQIGCLLTAILNRCRLSADDFIYADPPYDVEFTTYSAGGFGWDDQVRTAEWLAAHAGRSCCRIRRRRAWLSFMRNWDLRLSISPGQGGLVAPVTARRRKKFWQPRVFKFRYWS